MPNFLSRVVANAADQVGLIVKGFAGQTGVLQSWRNSADTELAYVSAAGAFFATTTIVAGSHIISGGSLIGAYFENAGTDGPYIAPAASKISVVNRNDAANIPLVIKGMAAQTGDLQRWVDSADAILGKVSAAGLMTMAAGYVFGSNALSWTQNGFVLQANSSVGVPSGVLGVGRGPDGDAGIAVQTSVGTQKGLLVNGTADQTDNLAEFATTGAALTKVGPNGMLTAPGLLSTPFALTDGANIAVNAANGCLQRVTLAGNRTLDAPSNGVDGQCIMLEFKQDGTGTRTLNTAAYNFGTDLTSVTLSTAAGVTDRMLVMYNSVRTEWDVIGFKKGF